MQNSVKKMLARMFADKKRQKKIVAVICALSVLVTTGVFSELMQPVITMTPDPICGAAAHTHSADCYKTELVCAIAEGDEHTHGEGCSENVLACGLSEHVHVESCYPEKIEEPMVQVISEDGDIVEVPEVTEAPAVISEDEPVVTAEPVTAEEPAVTEAPAATEEPAATDEPTATEEPAATAEPAAPAVSVSAATANIAVGQTAVWNFTASGAAEASYIITDSEGNEVASGSLTAESTQVEWLADREGAFTLTVLASNETGKNSANATVTVEAVTELTAAVRAGARSVFAGETASFSFAYAGGAEPVSVKIVIENNGAILADIPEFASNVTVDIPAHDEVTAVKATITVTDSLGAVATADCEIPVAVRKVENETIWTKSVETELGDDWRENLIAVANTQLGYAESDVNFVIDEEGKQHGYTRYGHWYGSSYAEWCAMFVSFNLNYAEIPEKYFPREANCERWIAELKYRDLYEDAKDYEPEVGDLIFFDWEEDGESDHVGIVLSVTDQKIETIEGNASAAVRIREYDRKDDAGILFGYGLMTEAFENYIADELELDLETGVNAQALVVADADVLPAPGETDEPAEQIAAGAIVNVLAAEQDLAEIWYEIEGEGLTGFVPAEALELNYIEPETLVPVVSAYETLSAEVAAYNAPAEPAEDAEEYNAAREAAEAELLAKIEAAYAEGQLSDEEYSDLYLQLTGELPAIEEEVVEAEPDPVAVSMEIVEIDEENSNLVMTAVLTGINAEDYNWQWQVAASEEGPWTDIEGATELTYTVALTDETFNSFYRIYGDCAVVTDVPLEEEEEVVFASVLTEEGEAIALANETDTEENKYGISEELTNGDIVSRAISGSGSTRSVEYFFVLTDENMKVLLDEAGKPKLLSSKDTVTVTGATTNNSYGTAVVAEDLFEDSTYNNSQYSYVGAYFATNVTGTQTQMHSMAVYRGRNSSSYSFRYRATENSNYTTYSSTSASLYIAIKANTVNVTFNAGDGGAFADGTTTKIVPVTPGSTLTKDQIPTPVKDGYAVASWKATVNGVPVEKTPEELLSYQIDAAIEFTAEWKQAYTVTFKDSVLTSENTAVSKPYVKVSGGEGEYVTVPVADVPVWTRSGYQLKWVREGDDSGTAYDAAGIAELQIGSNATFVTKWVPTIGVVDSANLAYTASEALPSVVVNDEGAAAITVKNGEGYSWSICGTDAGSVAEMLSAEGGTLKSGAAYTATTNADGTITFSFTGLTSVMTLSPVKKMTVAYAMEITKVKVAEANRKDQYVYGTPQYQDFDYDPSINNVKLNYSEALVVDSDGGYTVKAPDQDYVTVSILDNPTEPAAAEHEDTQYFYVFDHWLASDGKTVVEAGTKINVDGTITDANGNKVTLVNADGVIELTAVWRTHIMMGSAYIWEGANFYVSLDSTSFDYAGNVNSNSGDDFSSSLYSTYVYGSTAENFNSYSAESGTKTNGKAMIDLMTQSNSGRKDYPYLLAYTPAGTSEQDLYDVDKLIRTLTYKSRYGLTLENIPTDEYICEQMRNFLNEGNQITVNGVAYNSSNSNLVNASNFEVRWTTFKHEWDGWHVDGVLVAKSGKLTITKTFEGDEIMIEDVKADKNGDFSITVDHTTANTSVDQAYYVLDIDHKRTTSDSNTNVGYDSYDASTNTYTWTLDVIANSSYKVTESNYIHTNGEKVTSAQYSVINDPKLSSRWKTYTSAGVTVTTIGYPDDMEEGSYQTIRLLNSYVPQKTMLVRKIDAETGNLMPDIEFTVKAKDSAAYDTDFTLWHKTGTVGGTYYTYPPANTGYDELEAGTDGIVVTTGTQGYFMISWAQDQNWDGKVLEFSEFLKDGYAAHGMVTVTLGEEGIDSVTGIDTTDDSAEFWDQTNKLSITIANNPVKTQIKAIKHWENVSPDDAPPVQLELRRVEGNTTVSMGSGYTVTLDGVPDGGTDTNINGEILPWQYHWYDVPLYADGKLAEYVLQEWSIGSTQYDSNADTDGYTDYQVSQKKIVYDTNAEGVTTSAKIEITNSLLTGTVNFKKVDSVSKTGLENAVFTIYSDEACKNRVDAFTSKANGDVDITLSAGIYYMKETTVPDGYDPNDTVYRLTIKGKGQCIIEAIGVGTDGKTTYTPITDNAIPNTRTVFPAVAIMKVDQSNNPLSGATFSLEKLNAEKNEYSSTGVVLSGNTQWTIGGANGSYQLAPGSYQLVETAAPAGYYRMTGKIQFTVTETGTITYDAATLPSGVAPAGNNTAEVSFTVTNHTGSELPSTGGPGTLLNTIGGLLLMAASLLYGFGQRRKRERGAEG